MKKSQGRLVSSHKSTTKKPNQTNIVPFWKQRGVSMNSWLVER